MAQTMGRLVTTVLQSDSEMQPKLSPIHVPPDEDDGTATDDGTSTVCAPEDRHDTGTPQLSPSHSRATFSRRAPDIPTPNKLSTRTPLMKKTSSHPPALSNLPLPPPTSPPSSNRDVSLHADSDIDERLSPPPPGKTPSPPPPTQASTPPPDKPPMITSPKTPPPPPPPPPEEPAKTPPPKHPLTTQTPPLGDDAQKKRSEGLQPRTPHEVASRSPSMGGAQLMPPDIPDVPSPPPSPPRTSPSTTSTGSAQESLGIGSIPPPPPPMASPPLHEPTSEKRHPHKDQSPNVLSPTPRRPAQPLGNLRRQMHGRHLRTVPSDDSLTSGSNDATDKFPPTYPAFQRRTRHLRSMSQTKADMTRGITARAVQLEERNDTVPLSRQSTRRAPKPANAQVLWSNLHNRRENLYKKRVNMSKDRAALRKLRSRRDEAENAILTILRRLLPSVGDEYRASFADIQALSDEYMTLERRYEQNELILDELEVELIKLETDFFTNLASQQQFEMVADSHDRAFEENSPGQEFSQPLPMSREEIPLEVRGIPADGVREDIHPLYQEFQDAVGEFNLASESWQELQTARSNIEFRITIDKHVPGQGLDEEALEFLEDYPEEESLRLRQLQEARTNVERLRALCLERGVMRKDIPFQLAYVLRRSFPHESDEVDLGEDIDLPERRSPGSLEGEGEGKGSRKLARPLFPRLLTQEPHLFGEFPLLPEQALEAAKELPKNDPKRDEKIREAEEALQFHQILASDKHHPSTMVDRWLFHQLRLSPHMGRLWVNLLLGGGRKLRKSWEQDLLDSWWDDDVVSDESGEGEGEGDEDGESTVARSGAVGGSDNGGELSAVGVKASEAVEVAIEDSG